MPKEDKTQPLNKVWRQRRPRAASKANEKPVGPSETLVEDSVVPVDSEQNESKKVAEPEAAILETRIPGTTSPTKKARRDKIYDTASPAGYQATPVLFASPTSVPLTALPVELSPEHEIQPNDLLASTTKAEEGLEEPLSRSRHDQYRRTPGSVQADDLEIIESYPSGDSLFSPVVLPKQVETDDVAVELDRTRLHSPRCRLSFETDDEIEEALAEKQSFPYTPIELAPVIAGAPPKEDVDFDAAAFDLPKVVRDNYRTLGIEKLYQWQYDCLKAPGVLAGGNLVYSAPTSAGKTFGRTSAWLR